jgi:putative ABC transport system permease protein
MDGLRQDLRFALRVMRRRPLHAAVAVGTLGIALGANASVYSVAQATLFRTLPYEAPDRVVSVEGSMDYVLEPSEALGWEVTEDFRTMPGIRAAGLYVPGGGANLVAGDGASRLTLTHVSENFFEVLGVRLPLGSGHLRVEDPNSVVISHRLWVDAFGADPDILGHAIELDGSRFAVVGVAPPGVAFPGETDVWIPQPLRYEFLTGATSPTFVARLTEAAVRTDVEALLRERTPSSDVETPPGLSGPPPPSLVPLRDVLVEEVERPVRILMLAAGLVLLLGSLNLAGVTVSGLLGREAEIRVRLAVGGARARVFRQIFVETLVVGFAGASLAAFLAVAGVDVLVASLPGAVPGLADATVGPGTVVAVAALALAACVVIGVVPALQAVSRGAALASSARSTQTRRQIRLQGGLIVAQVTVALVLVVGAGLLSESLRRLMAVPLGIDTENVLTARVQLGSSAYPGAQERALYVDRALEALAGLPGATAAGAVSALPLSHAMGIGFGMKRTDEPDDARRFAVWLTATPGYFQAIGNRFLKGRAFSDPGDEASDEVVLSRAAAVAVAGSADVVGATIHLRRGRGSWVPVVVRGVTEDVLRAGPDGSPTPIVYEPMKGSATGIGLVLRAEGNPEDLAAVVDRRLRTVDPATPPFAIRTTGQALAQELASRRSLSIASSFFGLMAVVLAALGLYGLMAQAVLRRRREIGIRIALGAAGRRLVSDTLRRALALALVGVLMGLPLAVWGATFLEEVLFEVSAADPRILVSAPLFILAVALVASWAPARRAGAMDPMEIVNTE